MKAKFKFEYFIFYLLKYKIAKIKMIIQRIMDGLKG